MPFDDGKKTVSGSIAHTDDAAAKVPFVSVKCGIEPTLTGVSAVKCTQTGKNLLNAPLEQGQYGSNGGYSGGSNRICIRKENGFTLPVGIHTLSIDGLDTCTVLFFTADGSSVADNQYATSWHNLPFTFEVSNSDYIVVFTARKSDNSNISPSDYEAQIEAGSTATEYTEYTAPTTHTVQLGRTIYGGTADVVKGEGQGICGKITYNGSENWNVYSSGNGYAIGLPTMERGTWYSSDLALSYPLPKAPNNDNLGVRIGVNNDGIYVVQANTIEGVTDLTSFKAWLLENPLTIIYPLETPTDFTFTPITPTPETVGKVNNVYCDTGNTELTYYDNAHGFAEVTVNKTGKNLFDISKVATTGTTAGISWSVSGNEITISGTATSSGWKTFVEFKLPHKGTYHFHMNATGNVGYFLRGWTQLVGKDVTEVCNDPSQVYRIAIAVTTTGQTYEGTISEIQIEVGDAYTSYEPYEAVSKTAYLHKVIYGGQADVVKGTCEPKNLLKLSDGTYSIGNTGASATISNGSIVVTGTTTNSGGRTTRLSDYFILHAGTYSLSPVISASPYVRSYLNKKSDNTVVGYSSGYSFTVNEDVEVYFGINVESGYTYDATITPQLEAGSSVSDYAPYFEPFSFPPVNIATAQGENNLFANEGDSAITYRKDTE